MNRRERERADAALAREVSTLLRRVDPPPAHVKDAAHGLLSWRTIDAALAELLRDSARKARRGAP
jgi:hypothetical protein